MNEQTKMRTSVWRDANNQLIFLRETGYFVGTRGEVWKTTDKIKVNNLAGTAALINLAPRQPRNVKRVYEPKFGWLRDFVACIETHKEAPECAS